MSQIEQQPISPILVSAGVLPKELQYAPTAEQKLLVPIIYIGRSSGKDDPLIDGHKPGDVCELGKDWREGLELRAARELEEGSLVDLEEAFEEDLTHEDLR